MKQKSIGYISPAGIYFFLGGGGAHNKTFYSVACSPYCVLYIDDRLPYAPLELCSYWGCGQVFIYLETELMQ